MPVDLMVLLAAFASGLLGSVHCAAMCGGIATSLSTGQRDGLWMAALPNLGRVLGYALAGAIVGGIGGGLLGVARVPGLGMAMRAMVGIVLVIAGLLTLAGPWLMHAPVLHGVLVALGCRSLP